MSFVQGVLAELHVVVQNGSLAQVASSQSVVPSQLSSMPLLHRPTSDEGADPQSCGQLHAVSSPSQEKSPQTGTGQSISQVVESSEPLHVPSPQQYCTSVTSLRLHVFPEPVHLLSQFPPGPPEQQ
mmetsp:Transcript_22930/g.33689  ORF Transcript_22930/g.33689 Transcript_22930/m.33689 type:complete len:126 (-) Transcript_22930:389-766(-)